MRLDVLRREPRGVFARFHLNGPRLFNRSRRCSQFRVPALRRAQVLTLLRLPFLFAAIFDPSYGMKT
ncbi:hypothetical protein MESS4_330092 [Mesorhizobium sp. STM 4661]|nr:hypothetical protein MESS4_330092 [Mesorhizobium sp. STM 4661]